MASLHAKMNTHECSEKNHWQKWKRRETIIQLRDCQKKIIVQKEINTKKCFFQRWIQHFKRTQESLAVGASKYNLILLEYI